MTTLERTPNVTKARRQQTQRAIRSDMVKSLLTRMVVGGVCVSMCWATQMVVAQVARPRTPAPAPIQPAPVQPASTQAPTLQPPGGKVLTPIAPPVKQSWWNDRVFYRVVVPAFADSESGPLANDGVGDLQGLIENLDYLNDGNPKSQTALGVTGLLLSALTPSPALFGAGATDLQDIDPKLGTIADLHRLVEQAHARGMNVVVDLPVTRTSIKHRWFSDASSPTSFKRDWYVWSKTNPPEAEALSPTGKPFLHPGPGESKDLFYLGFSGADIAELNLKNKDVTGTVYEAALFWLKPAKEGGMGVDGLRFDSVRFSLVDGKLVADTQERKAWLEDLFGGIKRVKREAAVMADLGPTNVARSYAPENGHLPVDTDLPAAILASMNSTNARPLLTAYERVNDAYPLNQFATALTLDDQPRAGTVVKDPKLLASAAALLLASPGVPILNFGDEIGMTGEAGMRTPMQWTSGPNAGFSKATPFAPVASGYEQVNVQALSGEPGSVFNTCRDMLRLRQAMPALSKGTFTPLLVDRPDILAFLRSAPQAQVKGENRPPVQHVLVILNLSVNATNEYAISTPTSPLRPPLATMVRAGTGLSLVPTVNAEGGFKDFQPVLLLRPRTLYVIEFVLP